MLLMEILPSTKIFIRIQFLIVIAYRGGSLYNEKSSRQQTSMCLKFPALSVAENDKEQLSCKKTV